jgi:hypothetical protein
LSPDDDKKPDSGVKSPDESAPNEKEREPVGVDISGLDTFTTLKLFLSILADQAWRKMGMIADPRTNKVEKDMNQAKTAINCFQFMLKELETHLTEDEKNKLNNVLNDLQINFVTHQ